MVLQKPQPQTDRLPPPRTLILDFTMTHPHYRRSHLHPIGQLTNIRRSDGTPELDETLRVVVNDDDFLKCRQTAFMTTFFVYCVS